MAKPKNPGEKRGGARRRSGGKLKPPGLQNLEGPVGNRPDHTEIDYDKFDACPDPPKWLKGDEFALEWWGDHAPMMFLIGILKPVNFEAFGMLASIYGEYREAVELLKQAKEESGATGLLATSGGKTVTSEALKIKRQAHKAYASATAEWYMLPSAATIKTPTKNAGANAGDFSTAGGAKLRAVK